jgi:hypothetical protein
MVQLAEVMIPCESLGHYARLGLDGKEQSAPMHVLELLFALLSRRVGRIFEENPKSSDEP